MRSILNSVPHSFYVCLFTGLLLCIPCHHEVQIEIKSIQGECYKLMGLQNMVMDKLIRRIAKIKSSGPRGK